MRGVKGADDPTECEFRTSQDVALWPIEIVSVSYFSYAPDLPLTALPVGQRIKATPAIGAMSKANALRRLAAPTDIAQAVSWLASAESGWITGATIDATGGLW